VLFFSRMVAYPFPSAATEAVVECSTERVRAFILFPHLKMVPLFRNECNNQAHQSLGRRPMPN